MSLPATAVLEIETGGSDTQCGGGFDPSSSGLLTNLAATVATGNAPVVTSASYNFVAGDVGAWLFIQSGTNWTPGWYKISSVASNAATVNATIGAALSKTYVANTVAGIATTASPTAGTGMIDYSQQSAAAATGTATSATTTVTATTSIFNPMMVGNFITDGTTYKIITAYTSSTIVTVDSAPSWTAATIYVGGALASPGKALTLAVAQNRVFIKNGNYTVSANITLNPSGVFPSSSSLPNRVTGYNSLRGDNPKTTSRPTLTASGTTTTLLAITTTGWWVENIILDCANVASNGITFPSSSTYSQVRFCKIKSFKTSGVSAGSSAAWLSIRECEITDGKTGSTAGILQTGSNSTGLHILNCVIHDNICHGISIGDLSAAIIGNLIYNNTGASSDGIAMTFGALVINNSISGNGRHGISISNASGGPYSINQSIRNNILSSNSSYGLSTLGSTLVSDSEWDGNAYYNNTSGTRNGVGTGTVDIILTADPFTSSSAGDFSLNKTLGGGAACRGLGFPATFPGATTIGYLDIGAAQHQDSGGGGILRAPGMTGGMEG